MDNEDFDLSIKYIELPDPMVIAEIIVNCLTNIHRSDKNTATNLIESIDIRDVALLDLTSIDSKEYKSENDNVLFGGFDKLVISICKELK